MSQETQLFRKSFIKGCGFIFGIIAVLAMLWIGYSYIAKDLVDSGIMYFGSKCIPTASAAHDSTVAIQGYNSLRPETIYEATIAYYNQIISILIFLAGVAGVIAFAHIGIISKEKAEEISESCVAKEVKHHFEKQAFHDSINQKVEDIYSDGEFGTLAQSIEDLKNKVGALELKYDRHDDLLQVQQELKAIEEIENIRDDHEGFE